MKVAGMFVVFTAVVTTGCAGGPIAQTPAEYRDSIAKGGFGTKHEMYEVNRPYSEVAKTLAEKSMECLNVSLEKSTCYNALNCKDHHVTYKPIVEQSKTKTEVSVQWKRLPMDAQLKNAEVPPPEDGLYIAVMDAVPSVKGGTTINLYTASLDHLQTVPNALKSWADGSNLGCPDLTRPYYY